MSSKSKKRKGGKGKRAFFGALGKRGTERGKVQGKF